MAGALGAVASLAVLEVVALADPRGSSVLEAIGNRVIDSFAASLKDLAVALFGTSDKDALQIGTALIAIAIGAALGTSLDRRPNVLVAGFAAFGGVGVLAVTVDAQGSVPVAILACALAAAAGIVVAIGLHGRWARRGEAAPGVEEASHAALGPSIGRRKVLLDSAVVAGGAILATALARSVRAGLRDTTEVVRRLRIPRAAKVVAVPEGTLDVGSEAVEGISPFVTPVDDFYRIDTAFRVPSIDVETWSVKVTGMVDRELSLSFDDLLARDLLEVPITIQCVSNEVGNHLVGTARWRGVLLADLLREAGVRDGAEQVIGESVDGFTAGFPLDAALDGRDALLVVGMDGEPLPPEHGFPARLVVPGLYGYVSATKWLSEIRVTTWDEEGFWIPRGWSRLGPIKIASRIDVPHSGAELAAGTVAVAGVAWAPQRGISKVEVRIDEGEWREARLGPVPSDDTWVQWVLEWPATAGDHRITVRATAGDGEIQTAEEAPPAPDGATGHHSVQVSVAP